MTRLLRATLSAIAWLKAWEHRIWWTVFLALVVSLAWRGVSIWLDPNPAKAAFTFFAWMGIVFLFTGQSVRLVLILWTIAALIVSNAHASDATYYADRFENHRMANGERFHQAAATCAHPRLPLGTVLHLRNPVTQAEATCLVTDRPARRIRHTDLPRSVFLRLGGELRRGTVPVVEEVAEVPVGRRMR